jgi:hypothetical protein
MVPFSSVYVVPLVFTVLGSPFVAIGRRAQRQNAAVRTWPQVKGRIVTSSVRTYATETLDTFDKNWAPNSPNNQGTIRVGTNSVAEARYTYEVAGQSREGTKVSRQGIGGGTLKAVEAARAWVDQHPPGTEVSVYVNPQDPAEAYIELSAHSVGALILLIWGGVFVFIGLLIFVIFLLN